MTDYKWGKGLLSILFWALIGGVGGITLMAVMRYIEPEAVKGAIVQGAPYLFWAATACGVIGLVGYVCFYHLLKKDHFSNEEQSFFERNENKISIVGIFSTLSVILNFTAFGVNLGQEIGMNFFGLFILNVVLSFVGEVANISLVKKVRPELNADPMDNSFKQDYYDRLDEYEKIQMGKVCFKSITGMTVAYVITFVVCWLLIMFLEINPIICLPIGVLWFVQTMLQLWYGCRYK